MIFFKYCFNQSFKDHTKCCHECLVIQNLDLSQDQGELTSWDLTRKCTTAHMANISGSCLVPHGTKPLPEHSVVLTYGQSKKEMPQASITQMCLDIIHFSSDPHPPRANYQTKLPWNPSLQLLRSDKTLTINSVLRVLGDSFVEVPKPSTCETSRVRNLVGSPHGNE